MFQRTRAAVWMTSACLSVACTDADAPTKEPRRDAGAKQQSAERADAQIEMDSGARKDTDTAGKGASAGKGATAGTGANAGTGGSKAKPKPSQRDAAADSGERKTDDDNDGGSAPTDAGLDAATARCDVAVAAPTTPTIWLVIDGSGSMLNPLNMTSEKTRWDTLRDTLLDAAQGPIKRFESKVQWGLLMYDGPNPGGGVQPLPDGGVLMLPPATTCPRTVSIPAQLDNFASISSAYMKLPLGGSTPTDRAFDALLSLLPSDQDALSRTSIVFATDGEPNDFCSTTGGVFDVPKDVRPLVIERVARAAELNVKTYVISLAGEDQNLMTHLGDVAKAGKTGKAPFVPSDQAALSDAITDIVGPDPSCEVPLLSEIDAAVSCGGAVQLDGKAIECNTPDGYTIHGSALRLSGSACDQYKSNPNKLRVALPCDAITTK